MINLVIVRSCGLQPYGYTMAILGNIVYSSVNILKIYDSFHILSIMSSFLHLQLSSYSPPALSLPLDPAYLLLIKRMTGFTQFKTDSEEFALLMAKVRH